MNPAPSMHSLLGIFGLQGPEFIILLGGALIAVGLPLFIVWLVHRSNTTRVPPPLPKAREDNAEDRPNRN